jgi:hypothetical protein
MDLAAFRAAYPEFDTTDYPDGMVSPYVTLAPLRVGADAWGDLADFGQGLWIAHNVVMAKRRAKAAAVGAVPGATQGVQTAKAVDKVSASYDAASVTIEGTGNWNATDYGVQFWQYAEQMGAGGLQL